MDTIWLMVTEICPIFGGEVPFTWFCFWDMYTMQHFLERKKGLTILWGPIYRQCTASIKCVFVFWSRCVSLWIGKKLKRHPWQALALSNGSLDKNVHLHILFPLYMWVDQRILMIQCLRAYIKFETKHEHFCRYTIHCWTF